MYNGGIVHNFHRVLQEILIRLFDVLKYLDLYSSNGKRSSALTNPLQNEHIKLLQSLLSEQFYSAIYLQ